MAKTAGLKIFTTEDFSYRAVVTKAGTYTVLTSDEFVQINGAYTMTLPPLNTLATTMTKKKSYKFSNVHATADATIQPGTSTATGTADTINGKALYTLKPGESIVISGNEVGTDWDIVSPFPPPALTRVPFAVVVQSSGSATPVNVFDANGAPATLDITGVLASVVTVGSGTVNVFQQGTSSICTIAITSMSSGYALAGMVISPSTALACQAVAKGAAITVSNTGSGVFNMFIVGTMQQYA